VATAALKILGTLVTSEDLSRSPTE
jgi:hypothetical protein